MPCGVSVGKVLLDTSGNPYHYDFVYANQELERICGGDVHRLRVLAQNLFADGTEEILDKCYKAAYLGETVEYFRYSSISCRYLQLTLYQYEVGYAACIIRDITQSHIYEDALLSLTNIRNELRTKDTIEYKYKRRVGNEEEWCLTTITVGERNEGIPRTATIAIRSIQELVEEEERRRKLLITDSLSRMAGGFFIYQADESEQLIYANPPVLELYGCQSMEEFREFVGNSFRGMVHPEDIERVERIIHDQISYSSRSMDYVEYRIIRKDGSIRWVEDYGHLEKSALAGNLFYVFIADVTDSRMKC